MPPQRLMRAFLFLWVVTGIALLYGSVATIKSALGSSHGNPHLLVLGSIEAVAAVFFLIPRWMRAGGAGLLLTISIAFAVHTLLREFRGDLLLYGAAVLFILIHGPLTREQFRVTVSSRAA